MNETLRRHEQAVGIDAIVSCAWSRGGAVDMSRDGVELVKFCDIMMGCIESVKVGGVYKNKTFSSMIPKKVIRVHKGIVVTDATKYMSDVSVTYHEKQFLRDYELVS